jgi:hypothetical protein
MAVVGAGLAMAVRSGVDQGVLLTLLGLGAVLPLAPVGYALAVRQSEVARYARLLAGAERLAAGELHVFAASLGDDPVARLGAAVNTLADGVRADRLEGESRRVLEQSMIREKT